MDTFHVTSSIAGSHLTRTPDRQYAGLVYECRRTDEVIRIDGILTELSWESAKEATLSLADSSASPFFGTKARLLWNDSHLYAAFQCEDDGVYATKTEKNDALWQEEAVELFLDFEGQGKRYVEIEVNPLNAVFDKFMNGIRDPLPEALWNSGVKTAVRHESRSINGSSRVFRWTVELAFPFEALRCKDHSTPKPGDEWRMNLYRVKHQPIEEFSAWSPTHRIDFHQPDKFGILFFSNKNVTEVEHGVF